MSAPSGTARPLGEIAPLTHWIGGEPVELPADGQIEILNPATAEIIAHVPNGSAEAVGHAVAAARRAGTEWGRTTPAARADALLELAELVQSYAEELAALEVRNTGRPASLAAEELPICVDELRFFAAAARCLGGLPAGEYAPGYTSMVRREPLGVVGQITPWNYPLMMAIWKIGPALAAGNTIVLKPSELTPLTTLRLAGLAAGVLPPGVLNVVCGDGAAGAAIAAHPDVRMVALTGSVPTGRRVAQSAAETVKRVHLELGGKAPMVVFADADPEAVARGVRLGAFTNAGQDCTAVARLLVAEEVYERTLEHVVAAARSVLVGDPCEDPDTEMGPLISARQRERVLGFVDRARAQGRVLCGGGSPERPGFFVEPTVVADVGQQDEIVQEEVFGPVVTVQPFSDEDEAIAMANDVRYGLAASVWTQNIERAMRASRELEFGAVWINDHLPFISEMPHGGVKQSGYGKDLSLYAVEEYTTVKHVMVRHDQTGGTP
jgi:betaine-aldehyde dehydrogenase